MENNLKVYSSWNQMRAVERASERVQSWPEWKRAAISYRSQDPKDQIITRITSNRTPWSNV